MDGEADRAAAAASTATTMHCTVSILTHGLELEVPCGGGGD